MASLPMGIKNSSPQGHLRGVHELPCIIRLAQWSKCSKKKKKKKVVFFLIHPSQLRLHLVSQLLPFPKAPATLLPHRLCVLLFSSTNSHQFPRSSLSIPSWLQSLTISTAPSAPNTRQMGREVPALITAHLKAVCSSRRFCVLWERTSASQPHGFG